MSQENTPEQCTVHSVVFLDTAKAQQHLPVNVPTSQHTYPKEGGTRVHNIGNLNHKAPLGIGVVVGKHLQCHCCNAASSEAVKVCVLLIKRSLQFGECTTVAE